MIDQIRCLGQDPQRLLETSAQAQEPDQKPLTEMANQPEIVQTLAALDPMWEALSPPEQARIVELLVERVDYDGASGKVAITFDHSGIKTLADELANQRKERTA